MKKTIGQKQHTGIVMALALLLCAMLLPLNTYAANNTANLTVRQEFTLSNATGNVNTTGTYELSANDTNAPMPSGITGTYTFTIDGDDSKTIQLEPTTTGDFYYTLEQISDTTSDAGKYTFSNTVYTVRVLVKGTTGSYSTQLVVYDSEGTKPNEVLYRNTFTGTTAPDANPTIPEQIKQLIKTGDTANLALLGGLLTASTAALIVLLAKRRKRRQAETAGAADHTPAAIRSA